MSAYRWAASSGLFLGSISTALALEEMLSLRMLEPALALCAFLLASLLGIAAALVARFLHQDQANPTLLGHRAAAFVGLALNLWPWLQFVVMIWFWKIGPP